MLKIKNYIRHLVTGKNYDEKKYINNLIKCGVKIGTNFRIFDVFNTFIDTQNPFMISLGNNVSITSGCKILTHDYSYSVIANKNGHVCGGVGYVNIGDNVFIGMNSIILKNTKVGNNVIIGANSVVSGILESDCVYAGNPAKKLMSIDEFYNKKRKNMLDECKNIYNIYYERYGVNPPRKIFKEYNVLFSKNENTKYEDDYLKRFGNYEQILKVKKEDNIFENYNEFIKFLEKNRRSKNLKEKERRN